MCNWDFENWDCRMHSASWAQNDDYSQSGRTPIRELNITRPGAAVTHIFVTVSDSQNAVLYQTFSFILLKKYQCTRFWVWNMCFPLFKKLYGATLRNKLQRMENRAARIITKCGYEYRSTALLCYLNLRNLETKRNHQLSILMFKLSQGLRRCYTVQFFVQLVLQFCCDTSCTRNCTV